MHYVISTTWGPTDVTRAALPFVFAASALQANDTVMIMLFHDAVTVALDGAHQKMIPFGPLQNLRKYSPAPMPRFWCANPAPRRGPSRKTCWWRTHHLAA